VVSAQELLANGEVQPPPLVIEGMLHRGSKLVLGSTSKARKTWALLGLGIAVATGKNWLDRITNPGRVFFINFEIHEPFLKQRVEHICKALNVAPPADLDLWTLRGHCAPLEILLPRILERLNSVGYCLVIVDPIYKSLGNRNENSAGDIASLCNLLERLAVEGNVGVAISAHFAIQNTEPSHASRYADPIEATGKVCPLGITEDR